MPKKAPAKGAKSPRKPVTATPKRAARRPGTRSGFTPVPDATMDDVLGIVAGGSSVNSALRDLAVTPAQFYRTIAADAAWTEKYRRARAACMDAVCDSLIELADEHPPLVAAGENSDPRVDPGWVAWQRNRIHAREWMLGRLAPKKYGDRLAAEVSGPDAGPIETASGIPPGVLASMEVIRRRIAEVSAVKQSAPSPGTDSDV